MDALRGFTGMLDRSRMALCIFMFTVFIINPLNFFFAGQDSLNGADYSLAHGTSRTLQSTTGKLLLQAVFGTVVSGMVNTPETFYNASSRTML